MLDDPRLSRRARSRKEKAGRLTYSTVNFWEIALKLGRSGLEFALPRAWDDELVGELRVIEVGRVQLEPQHCRRLQDLPLHHQDPFDWMLIAQAQTEEFAILTADSRFEKDEVEIVW